MSGQPVAEEATGPLVPGTSGIAGLSPFRRESADPHPWVEALRTAWENRDALSYSWRILNRGVCTACSLGGRGVPNDHVSGRHLCTAQLGALRMHTDSALRPHDLVRLSDLREMSRAELATLGRLPFPFVRRPGERGFTRLTWTRTHELLAAHGGGDRFGLVHGESPCLETSYAFARAAQALQAQTATLGGEMLSRSAMALQAALGVPRAPGDFSAFNDADLIVLWGVNPASNPTLTRWLASAKARGARLVVIDPRREPELLATWGPHLPSALFGTQLADDHLAVHRGEDESLLRAVQKQLIRWNAVATGIDDLPSWGAYRAGLDGLPLRSLVQRSGITAGQIHWLAQHYARAERPLSVWGSGLTDSGVEPVRALAELHGLIGAADRLIWLPRGVGALHAEAAGLTGSAAELLEGARQDGLDALYLLNADLTATPHASGVAEAFAGTDLRLHQATHLDPSMLVEGPGPVVLLPAQGIYEQSGTLVASAESRFRFSPAIEGHPQIGDARPGWSIPADVVLALRGADAGVRFSSPVEIREEASRSDPTLAGLRTLTESGHWYRRPLAAPQVCFTAPSPLETRERGLQISVKHGGAIEMSEVTGSSLGLVDGGMARVQTLHGACVGRVRFIELEPDLIFLPAPEGYALWGSDGTLPAIQVDRL